MSTRVELGLARVVQASERVGDCVNRDALDFKRRLQGVFA
jgi:hypothetical protein